MAGTPTNVTLSSGINKLSLFWDSMSGADTYRIYISGTSSFLVNERFPNFDKWTVSLQYGGAYESLDALGGYAIFDVGQYVTGTECHMIRDEAVASGDFEYTLDYDSFSYDNASHPPYFYFAAQFGLLLWTSVYIQLSYDSGHSAYIMTAAIYNTFGLVESDAKYMSVIPEKVRIKRSGTSLSAYYYNGINWIEMVNSDIGAGADTINQLILGFSADGTANGGTMKVSNLIYSTGTNMIPYIPQNHYEISIGGSYGPLIVGATRIVTIPEGTILKSVSGIEYIVLETITTIVGNNKIYVVSKSGGSSGNLSSGNSLTFVNTISGVSSTATVDSDGITGGFDLDPNITYYLMVTSIESGVESAPSSEVSGAAYILPSYGLLGDVEIDPELGDLLTDSSNTKSSSGIDYSLESAVMISLFTDKRANKDSILPDESGSKRGWWGDQIFPDVDGDQIGSHLWLLERSKTTPDVLVKAKQYIKEALQWMIDDRVIQKFDVSVERNVNSPNDGLYFNVILYKTDGTRTALNFDGNWGVKLR